MEGRVIAIGDIHGCFAEFERLVELLALTSQDRLILLGDLVNRGPESHRVVDLARHLKATALLGNHEWRLLRWRAFDGAGIVLKDYDHETIDQLTEEDWSYLRAMASHRYEPELNTIFVHAGFLPNIPWRSQTVSVFTDIQVIDEHGQPHRQGECPTGRPWAELWPGPERVVYGHRPRKEPQLVGLTVGLDTGCAFGGALTAYILPEGRLLQVRARRTYVAKKLN